MDVNDITEVADMKNRSEQRNDELQKALHTPTVEPHGDDDNMDGENFFGTQRLPTGAVGPPGPRLVTVRRGIDRRQQVGVEERSGSSAGQALIETRTTSRRKCVALPTAGVDSYSWRPTDRHDVGMSAPTVDGRSGVERRDRPRYNNIPS